MKRVALAFALCFIASLARASPVSYVPGTSPPNVLPASRDVIWSEPPDLNGLIGSSEQILAFGLETELANDFVPTASFVGVATWWGGFWNNSTPCQPGIPTPGFNLRFYDDAGCVPGRIIADVSATTFTEESVGCQQGVFPMFKWSAEVCVDVTAGSLYWFGAQMKDHAFPPQAGRLASAGVVGCDTVFKSAYFGYPDWTPAIDVFGVAFDCSQEFTNGGCIPPPEHPGACCLGNGECQVMWGYDCSAQNGQYQGDDVPCDPNPCPPTLTRSTTWGAIKGSYR